jgi:hypothetical protein
MNRILLRCFLVLLAGLLGACSSFDQHWKEAGSGKNGLTRWNGQWKSGKNLYVNGAYHHGRLRCVIAPQPDKELKVYFHANWLMFSGNYDMTLQPVKAGPRRRNTGEYEGTHELPAAFGGVYHYRATIAGNHFKAHYTCSIDQGIFELTRVP